MNLKYFLALLFVIGSWTFRGVVSAQETNVQTINVPLPSPFNLLSVPLDWKLEDQYSDDGLCDLEFINIHNTNVSFDLLGSKPQKNISLKAVENQIKKAIKQKQPKNPPKIKYKQFGKFQWLEVTAKGKIKRTIHNNDSRYELFELASKIKIDETNYEVTCVIKTMNLSYFTVVNNRVIYIDFTAPNELFDSYLPLFEETMNSICQ